jgi:hypothetical protein
MNPPPVFPFDYDTLTLDLALLRFQSDAMMLAICLVSGFAGLFTGGVLGTEDAGNSGNERVT